MKIHLPLDQDKIPFTWLPFDFERLENGSVIVVGVAGDWELLSGDEFEELTEESAISYHLAKRLAARHIIRISDEDAVNELVPLKIATRFRDLSDGPGLHIFVVTLRCEHSCGYCQVSRKSTSGSVFDMSEEIALASLQVAFQSPSKTLKIEIQGGEPLLNFSLIRFIVTEAKRLNENAHKDLQFVIASNLALLDDEVVAFSREHQIFFSTSLDGPPELHNRNRHRPGLNSWELVKDGVKRIREELGPNFVSALMTTTVESLRFDTQIIDEYVRQGFHEIFLRPMSPYGFAVRGKGYDSYDGADWMHFYIRGLEHVISLNRKGYEIKELMASLYLQKCLTNENGRYVDLSTPTGAGLGALVYNYDGKVYVSDEGRMLKEMGDDRFVLGSVFEHRLVDLLTTESFLEVVEESFAPSNPMCADCALRLYCGSDPVFHYTTQRDLVGFKPVSSFCQRTRSIVPYLLRRYSEDDFCRDLFDRWASQ